MGEKRANRGRLAVTEIERFKAILPAKRNEILGNVECMESETLRREKRDLSNMSIHMVDVGTGTYDLENILGLMESERKILSEIDGVLNRIEGGTYGICEGNGEPILKERLRAIPWARYCVACAGLSEKGLFVGEDFFGELDYGGQTGEGQDEDFDNSAIV